MFHNQKKYNCPVKFWMGLDYPASPPICYVSPTRDMGIKPRHVHVDNAGFIYHQYLTQWNVRSSLKDLCTTLTTVFSKDPPVYAKPSGGQAAAHMPSQQATVNLQPAVQQPLHPPAASPESEPVRAPTAAAAHSQPPSRNPPSQASSRPPPPSTSSQPAPPSWAASGAGGWAVGSSLAATTAAEEESKDSLILFVMSKINVSLKNAPPMRMCAPKYLISSQFFGGTGPSCRGGYGTHTWGSWNLLFVYCWTIQ